MSFVFSGHPDHRRVFCVKLGEEKGYSVGLCLLAGFFGGFLALIVILLLPDQNRVRRRWNARSRLTKKRWTT